LIWVKETLWRSGYNQHIRRTAMAKISINSQIEFGESFIRKNLADIPELELNLVTLPAGQSLPKHNANSNVRLLVLQGELAVDLNGEIVELGAHEMADTVIGTPMQIMNRSQAHTAFLVIKTPRPVG
jgi:quercetin dioxygenase-like cupin family protein